MNEKEYWMKLFKAALIRAVRTMAQTALGMFTVGMAMEEVKWSYVASVALVSGIYSLITSIAGLPEVESEGSGDVDRK
jgi:hypothetical protein